MGFLDRFKRNKSEEKQAKGLSRSDKSFNDLAGIELGAKRPVLQTKSALLADPHAFLEEAMIGLHQYIDHQSKQFGSEGLKALVSLVNGEMKIAIDNYSNYSRLAVKEKLTCLSFFIEDFQIGRPLRFWHVFSKRTPMAQEAYINIKGKVAKLVKVIALLEDIAEIYAEPGSDLEILCKKALESVSASYNDPLETIELKAKRFEIAITSFKLLEKLKERVTSHPTFSQQSEELIEKLCNAPIQYSEPVEIARRTLEARFEVFLKLNDILISQGLKEEDLASKMDSEATSKELKELIKLYQFVVPKQETKEQERCLYEYLDSLRYSSLLNHRESLREAIKSLYQEQEISFKMAKSPERDAQLNTLMEAEEAVVNLYQSLIDSTNMHPWVVTQLTVPSAIDIYIKLLEGRSTVKEDLQKKTWQELRFETKQNELTRLRESSAPFFNGKGCDSKKDKILRALPGEIAVGDEEITAYIRDRYKAIERKLPEAGVRAPLTR